MRLLANSALPLTTLLALSAPNEAQARSISTTQGAVTGPAADFPITVGDAYTIGSTTWTPADQLNYDAVGYAGLSDTLVGISAAHKTLPFPSYAEITSLESGRTILVRILARGPYDNDTLVALSPEAASQLGLAQGGRSPVRVRRVNPSEAERAELRGGGTAPMRMATPESLLKVLQRKLAQQSPTAPPPSEPPKMPTNLVNGPEAPRAANIAKSPSVAPSPPDIVERTSPPPAARPVVPAKLNPRPTTPSLTAPKNGTHVVQVAVFSTRDRAENVARSLGAQVSAVGKLWRVRMGPFVGAKEAATALEKAKRAGYSDARIQRVD